MTSAFKYWLQAPYGCQCRSTRRRLDSKEAPAARLLLDSAKCPQLSRGAPLLQGHVRRVGAAILLGQQHRCTAGARGALPEGARASHACSQRPRQRVARALAGCRQSLPQHASSPERAPERSSRDPLTHHMQPVPEPAQRARGDGGVAAQPSASTCSTHLVGLDVMRKRHGAAMNYRDSRERLIGSRPGRGEKVETRG